MADGPKTHDVIMIGAGPAALSAAIYTTREDIDTVLFERGVVGGMAAITDRIDNFPGFPEGVPGLEFADKMRQQAERFGAQIELGEVTRIQADVKAITDDGEYKRLETTEGEYLAKAILIATGSDYRKLGIPGEKEYYARGVHYCATCDGAFYRDKRLVVVGGGNSAVQEALFLTKFASHIDLLVRSDHMRASDILQSDLAKKADKITVHFNTTTDEIVAEDGKVVKVVGTDKIKGQKVDFPTDGVFIFVGLVPNTQFLVGSKIDLDEQGFVKVDDKFATSMPGVFAAGDVRQGAMMQVVGATGDGAGAAISIREYLTELNRQTIE
ncbi:MAG TPA: FAD-dependent oxidoreductase [Patescibacteria group bacterium]|nr:FAD-dependent oxidoreductase [Patescibacteria group bacterium]